MQLEIIFEEKLTPDLYSNYSRFVFSHMKKKLHKILQKHRKKYLVREDAILKCSLIKWIKSPPDSIDLVNYVENCLELVRFKGIYIIRINPHQRIFNSYTPVSQLIRILEYGTDKIPELPILRRLFSYYRINYKYKFVEYMKERYGQ